MAYIFIGAGWRGCLAWREAVEYLIATAGRRWSNRRMANEIIKITNGRRLGVLGLSIILGTIGAGGGQFLWMTTADLESVARPDPFTGSDAMVLQSQIADLQRQIDRLPPRELTERVTILELEVKALKERAAAQNPK